jgi:hypothetical protein
MRKFLAIISTILFIGLLTQCKSASFENEISLAGSWQVKLDSLNVGVNENWASEIFKDQLINLPGTLDDANIGTASTLEPGINNYVLSNLTRKHQYIGVAWYQKEIDIPKSWNGKEVNLVLERVIWESRVFVDGNFVGNANSLIGAHRYDLTKFLPLGKHIITIAIDNSNKFPLINQKGKKYKDPINKEMAHAYTNHTQIKWNGIVGDIILKTSEKNTPKNLQIYPNVENHNLNIGFEQENPDFQTMHYEIVSSDNKIIDKGLVKGANVKNGVINFEINQPDSLKTWDEFNPILYDFKLISIRDTLVARFGYKQIKNNEGVLKLNGHRIFLRGNLECVIFPLTGYPPMEKEGWTTLISQAKSYGLNHLRFHSWCPPKAAFEAADEAGFYLQVELPHWNLEVGKDEKTTQFLKAEGDKILNDYGNHPSFILMSLGNELQGDATLLNTMVAELKKKDNRHLYTTTTFSFQKPMGQLPEPQDEFFVTQWTDKGWIRGQGIFNKKAPHFDEDYTENSEHIMVPVISHEIGQYSVYPDISEISKYTGVLKPLNFISIKNELEKKGLIDFAPAFTQASGKLAAMLYKEEIERALKTPSFDGFQLLELQDFPGQGTALVGLLNAFWESKGIITPEEFRKFNSEIVPLIRFKRAVYERGDVFKASIEVANFFEEKEAQTIVWSIADDSGNQIKKGFIEHVNLHIGNNIDLGVIEFLIDAKEAKRLNIKVSLQGTVYQNEWPIWVYPKTLPINTNNIVITSSYEIAEQALENGKKVFLNPNPKSIEGIQGRFVPVFWSPVHFPDQPGTMGLLVDENHQAFKYFPTSSHTEWQWWDLCINSKSIIADSLNITPIVRVIDNFVTNHHLTNVFEAKVGNGKLIFSSIDLFTDLDKRPVARQLRYSLLNYMNSDAFKPSKSVNFSVFN